MLSVMAASGSWLINQLDEFSDLDLVLVIKEKISGDKSKMVAYAKQLTFFPVLQASMWARQGF